MDNQPDVEILIHIEAPSRALDDARYRSLATAYLGFEPTTREPIHNFSQNCYASSDRGGKQEPGFIPSSWLPAQDDEFSLIPSGMRLGSFRSPQASFRSVVDNAGSPQIRMDEIHEQAFVEEAPDDVPATQSSPWKTPPSIVQDSYPMNHRTDFMTTKATPTKVLENYLQHFDSPLGSSNRNSQSSGPAAAAASFRQTDISQNADLQPAAENPIPCTPQMIPHARNEPSILSDGIGGSQNSDEDEPRNNQSEVLANNEQPDEMIVEETVFISSTQPSSAQRAAPTRADSEPPPKSRRLVDLVSKTPHALARTFSDVGSRSVVQPKVPITVSFLSNSHGFTYESLEILPPEPPTSDRHIEPDSLITQGLQKLGRDVDISSRFRPKVQTRELAAFERGYWLVDCSTWEPQLKRDAWAFLANYIGTGTAGWGVRCKRDADFQELRVYCFGKVAAHIYYVLWMSSQRKIVFTGSSWIDAGGDTVITMGSRDNPKG